MKRLLTLLALALGTVLQSCQPAFAQTANYGGISIGGSYTTNCIPVAVTSITLQCAAIVDNGTTLTASELFIPVASSSATVVGGIGTASNGSGINFQPTQLQFMQSAQRLAALAASDFALAANSKFAWSNTSTDALGTATDTFIRKRSAANIAFGTSDVNGTPVAQTLSVQNAITGSNLAGAATFSLAASLGTGTGTPGTLVITGGDSSVASGATAQTQITRATFNNTKALTTGAATTAVSIPLATLQMTGGTIDYYIEATDGTNQCTSKNSVQYAAENSAGVFKATVTKVIGTSVTNCTGATTLTEAWAMSSANPSLIQVTPTLTGITATRFTMIYEVHHMGNTVPTI